MKKIKRVLTLFVLLSFFLPSVQNTKAQGSTGLHITYTLSVPGEQGIQHVTAQFDNIKTDSLTLVISPMEGFDMQSRFNTTWFYVDQIIAFAPDGIKSAIENRGVVSVNYPLFLRPIHYKVWSVNTNGNSSIRVEYDLTEKIFAGFLETVLIRPQNHADIATTTLQFQLPDKWVSGTVATEEQNGVFDLGRMDTMYGDNENSAYNYVPVAYAIAPENEMLFLTSECGRLIVTDYPRQLTWTLTDPTTQQEVMVKIFDYLCGAIGPLIPFNARLIYMSWPTWISEQIQPGLYSDYWQHNRTTDLSSGIPNPSFSPWRLATIQVGNTFPDQAPYSYDHFSHGLVRGWFNSGLLPFSNQQPYWFVKGGIVHYYQESDMSVVYGMYKVYERWQQLYEFYQKNFVETGLDRPLMSSGDNQSVIVFNTKYKSALWVFYLNQRIRATTDGQKGIGDVIRLIYDEFVGTEKVYTYRDIQNASETVSGQSMTDVFTDYLYTLKPLPLDEYFIDGDGDGLVNGLEMELGFDPNLFDSDADGLDDANEYLLDCKKSVIIEEHCIDAVPFNLRIPTSTPTPSPTLIPTSSATKVTLLSPTSVPTPKQSEKRSFPIAIVVMLVVSVLIGLIYLMRYFVVRGKHKGVKS